MSIVPIPLFFALESSEYPGYRLTQRGTQLVLAASNPDNPFQLWFKDTSWQCIHESANVYINHGSKLALKRPGEADQPSKATVGVYDPVVEDATLLWFESATDDSDGSIMIGSKMVHKNKESQSIDQPKNYPYPPTSSNSDPSSCSPQTRPWGTFYPSPVRPVGSGIGEPTDAWRLATPKCRSSSPDSIPAIVTTKATNASWRVVPFEPKVFKVECDWVSQMITYKTPHEPVSFVNAAPNKVDELNVVGVHQNNIKDDNGLWLRIPAGGKENTTFYTSFILINKGTGLALKGSTKTGDKTILTEYDVLDMDFVWSEDRVDGLLQYACINLSTAPQLFWTLQSDNGYQHSAWYHPLTLLPATKNDRQRWKFYLQNN